MTVDSWMQHQHPVISMILPLMQGHSRSAKAKYQRCMLSATKQVISIELATTVRHLLRDRDLDFANVFMTCPACSRLLSSNKIQSPICSLHNPRLFSTHPRFRPIMPSPRARRQPGCKYHAKLLITEMQKVQTATNYNCISSLTSVKCRL